MLPLAIGLGSGTQLLQPLAIAVIAGEVMILMILSLPINSVFFYSLQ